MLFFSPAFAQKMVSGRVLNQTDNSPIASATIQIKGTRGAAVSGADGSFTIKVPNDNSTLVISAIGFESVEYPVAGRSTLGDISLKVGNNTLNDVIVTGYTAQKKKDITGSVAIVNVDEMKQTPAGTVENMLQGQAAGVTVINSGAPGGGSNFRIRGITSLGNTDPLIIIDGIRAGINDINPDDIESIQVLKDAGAAAIYGVSGSNGVIIVTTKKGRGKAKISYDGYVGSQQPLKGYNLANPQETANAIWAQQINDGLPPSNVQYGNGATPVLPDYITPTNGHAGDSMTSPSKYVFDPGGLDDNRITKANKAGTNWWKTIFSPAIMQQHTLSASGSTEKTNYFFSINYLDQKGTLLGTYLKRYGVRANTVFNVKDHIRVGENAYVFYKQNPGFTNQNEGNTISYSYREQPIIPIYDIEGNFAGTGSKGLGNSQNPYADAVRSLNNKSNDWQMVGNVFAEVDFLKHFTARTQFGGNVDNYYYWYFTYTGYENAEGNTNSNGYTESSGYNSNWTYTNTLKYSNTFGNHSIAVLLGQEANSFYGRSLSASRGTYYTTDPNFWTLNAGAPASQTNSGGVYTNNTLSSYFGRLDYTYNDKYIIALTMRRDGSSYFGSAVQYGNFPSVTGAWRISSEDFMKDVTWINDLKIRGGWGKLGSLSNVPLYNQYTLFNQFASNSYYDITGASTSSQLGLYNSQLAGPATTWEKDVTTNLGFDATILSNKLDVSFDWYNKSINGLLFRPSVPATVGGATPPFINLGNITNKGVELSVTYHGQAGRDVKFDIGGEISAYRNKILALAGGNKYVDEFSAGSSRINAFSRAEIGHSIGEFFGYKVVGYFQDSADIAKSPTQDGAYPGLFKYADINHSGAIGDSDRTFIGNPNPKFTYGFNLHVAYKAFDVSAFFYGSYGNSVFNYIKYWIDFPQVFEGAISKDAVYNSWRPDNLNPKVPRLSTKANFSNTQQVNSWYVESGSYLRLKQLQIGYTLPKSVLQQFGIDKMRFYVQGTNLFTITKYTGLDPELQASDLGNNSNFGIDFGNYPSNQKSFYVGAQLTF